nr:MAG TPA: hypothetical protein [Bacteriophage sp.]
MRLLNIDRSKTPFFRSKPLNLVPMEPLPKRSSYLLVNSCVFHR